jgi:hypothetical protein
MYSPGDEDGRCRRSSVVPKPMMILEHQHWRRVFDQTVHNRWPTATEGWGRSMELDVDLCDRDHVPKLTLTAKYSRSLYVCIPALLPRSSVLFMSVRSVTRPYTWGGVKTTNHAPKRRYDDDSDCHLKIRSESAFANSRR